jgi:Fe-S-cluster containining protein
LSGDSLPVLHARKSAFSYRCNACSRCCYGKKIQVNPYELLRLARNLGTTTTDVIARYTVDGGTALATRPDASCVFLGVTGCTVHADRPLVCRLYPLGRIVQEDGRETFIENAPHPQTAGEYGFDGTVGDYLAIQGVAPYTEAADRYYAILTRLIQFEGASSIDARAPDDVPAHADSADDIVTGIDARGFVDADLAIQLDIERGGAPAPHAVDGLMARHLEIISRWSEVLGADVRRSSADRRD